MARNLIAKLTAPSGRFSAKVYRRPAHDDFRSVFYVEGVRQSYADAFTESQAEALEVTAWSLNLADDMDKQMQAQRGATSH